MIDIKSLRISDTDYYDSSIERLANEANNPNEYATKGLSAKELQRRFMAPSDLLRKHFNLLVGLLQGLDAEGKLTQESLVGVLQTGLSSHPTLYDLLIGFKEGTLPDAIVTGEGETLRSVLNTLSSDVENHKARLKSLDEDVGKVVESMEKINEALENGVYDGKDGFSPIVTVEENELETTVTIEDQEGEKSFAIPKSAEQIIFPHAMKTAYPVGNITLTNGVGVMAEAGDSLADLIRNVWFKVMQPTITQPSLSVSFGGAAKEVGTTIQPAYYATFSGGKYSFGPATGVTATEWRISDTEGYTAADPMGTTEVLLTDETAYQLTVECDHSAGAVPLDNEGNEATVSGIEAGTLTWKSSVVKGYRNSFFGALSAADVASWEQYITAGTLTISDCIRSLTKSGKALSNGSSFTITIPAGTVMVLFAYPATLRDVSSVKDVNGMNSRIEDSFVKETVSVEGANGYTAIPYKLFTMPSTPMAAANTFTVTI